MECLPVYITVAAGEANTHEGIESHLVGGCRWVRKLTSGHGGPAGVIECADAGLGHRQAALLARRLIGTSGPFPSLVEAMAHPTFLYLVPDAAMGPGVRVRWSFIGEDATLLARDYTLPAEQALGHFFAGVLDADLAGMRRGSLRCFVPLDDLAPQGTQLRLPCGDEPHRWAADPDEALMEMRARLHYQPRFCARPSTYFVCPACARPMSRQRTDGRPLLICRSCRIRIRHYADQAAAERLHRFCGAPLLARLTTTGVPYAGCDRCDRRPEERRPYAGADRIAS